MDKLIDALREEARQEEAASKMLADAKTARQTDRDDAWTDAGYAWITAEQTNRWKAATALERAVETLTLARAELSRNHVGVDFARENRSRFVVEQIDETLSLINGVEK